VSTTFAQGAPIVEIRGLAEKLDPNFIVMGSHGRTGISRALIGSVAEGVTRGSNVPVMIVPLPHKRADGRGRVSARALAPSNE
jgi:nucleotide-binding universal stress UspA family protein